MWRSLIDPFLPRACWACRAPLRANASLCASCTAALPWLGASPVREVHLDAAWAPLAFDGPARSLVHALKFRGALGLAHVLAGQLAEQAPPDLLASPARLVPVPAHPGRARRSGDRNPVS